MTESTAAVCQQCQLCARRPDRLVDGRFPGQRICAGCRSFQDERAAGTDFLNRLQQHQEGN